MLYKFVNNTVRAHDRENSRFSLFLLGVEIVKYAVCFLESLISGWWCCLNKHLTLKHKYHNDINVVALIVLGC